MKDEEAIQLTERLLASLADDFDEFKRLLRKIQKSPEKLVRVKRALRDHIKQLRCPRPEMSP